MSTAAASRSALRTFDITVFQDPETGHWVGINDALPVATESETYDGLVERVRLIGPEMAVENRLVAREEDVHLTFNTTTSDASR